MIPFLRGVPLAATFILLAACASSTPSLTPSPTTAVPPSATAHIPAPSPSARRPAELRVIPAAFEDQGHMLYIDSGSVRIGVDTAWGGAISEIWYRGENLINNYDGGRLMAVSFYDSDLPPVSGHPNDTGWNATPSDMYNNTNSPLEYAFSENVLDVRSRYIQWFPDDKGGGRGNPVPTDIIVETRIAFVNAPDLVRIGYTVLNEGSASHAIANQEFPFAYIRTPYDRYVTYAGSAPWTGSQPTIVTIPSTGTGGDTTIATERWAGFVGPDDDGLVLWAPQSYGQFSYGHFDNPGPLENSTFYLLPRSLFGLPPSSLRETHAFILLGNWIQSRAAIQQLAADLVFDDIMPPFGTIDVPRQGDTISGVASLDGWAIDNLGVDSIELTVDGKRLALASYGRQREDVARDYPGLPGSPYFGFSLQFDSRTLSNGQHKLEAIARDSSGNESQLRPGSLSITVEN